MEEEEEEEAHEISSNFMYLYLNASDFEIQKRRKDVAESPFLTDLKFFLFDK